MDAVPASAAITFDDFLKVDIRVGFITAAERVPKSPKLLQLQVDFGLELGTRQVLAGIGKSYAPEAIIGLPAAFVINLEPRPIMGMVSQAMILAAENVPEEGGITVLFLSKGVAAGARVG